MTNPGSLTRVSVTSTCQTQKLSHIVRGMATKIDPPADNEDLESESQRGRRTKNSLKSMDKSQKTRTKSLSALSQRQIDTVTSEMKLMSHGNAKCMSTYLMTPRQSCWSVSAAATTSARGAWRNQTKSMSC